MKYAIIVGDENDADYLYKITKINDEQEKLIRKIVPLLILRDKFIFDKARDWPLSEESDIRPQKYYGEVLNDVEIQEFNELCPRNIYCIAKIKILDVVSEENLLGK